MRARRGSSRNKPEAKVREPAKAHDHKPYLRRHNVKPLANEQHEVHKVPHANRRHAVRVKVRAHGARCSFVAIHPAEFNLGWPDVLNPNIVQHVFKNSERCVHVGLTAIIKESVGVAQLRRCANKGGNSGMYKTVIIVAAVMIQTLDKVVHQRLRRQPLLCNALPFPAKLFHALENVAVEAAAGPCAVLGPATLLPLLVPLLLLVRRCVAPRRKGLKQCIVGSAPFACKCHFFFMCKSNATRINNYYLFLFLLSS